MPSGQDARQRAVICQDCWFFKEMSCALANPEAGVCANKRPVRGRGDQPVAQQRVPIAAAFAAPTTPFSESAPESTFSLTTLAEQRAPRQAELVPLEQPVRSAPPSFREIRAGRAAAAARVPVAEVRIPIEELDSDQLRMPTMPGPDLGDLVERVRRRTAARLAQS